MIEDGHNALTRFARNKAGDTLRAVAHHTDEETTLIFARADIIAAFKTNESHAKTLLDGWRERAPITEPDEERLVGRGSLTATVEVYEHSTIVHITESATTQFTLSLESIASEQLNEFINGCLAQVEVEDASSE